MRKLVRRLIKFLLDTVTRMDVRGWEHVPEDNHFIVASNHLGLMDAFIGYYTLGHRELFTLVGEKWAKKPIFRFLGKQLNFIFIDRFNPDLKAMRNIIARMKEGKILVIAPEGTRSRTGAMIEGKQGISYLAAKLGYPILPIGIAGSSDKSLLAHLKRLKRLPVTVTAGPLFSLPPLPKEGRDETLAQYTDEIMCRIAALLPQEFRGVYTDHPRLLNFLNESR